jgi:hypothetical protein
VYGGWHCVEPVYPMPPHCPHCGTSEPVGAALVVVVVVENVVALLVVLVAVLLAVVAAVVLVTGTEPPSADTTESKNPALPYTCDMSLLLCVSHNPPNHQPPWRKALTKP